MDAQVGRILDELDALALTSETICVLHGDHGWQLGEHNSWHKYTNFELGGEPARPQLLQSSFPPLTSSTNFLNSLPTLRLCEARVPLIIRAPMMPSSISVLTVKLESSNAVPTKAGFVGLVAIFVGEKVGNLLGDLLGAVVGGVGREVVFGVGATVGAEVGAVVGIGVGAAVGATDQEAARVGKNSRTAGVELDTAWLIDQAPAPSSLLPVAASMESMLAAVNWPTSASDADNPATS